MTASLDHIDDAGGVTLHDAVRGAARWVAREALHYGGFVARSAFEAWLGAHGPGFPTAPNATGPGVQHEQRGK